MYPWWFQIFCLFVFGFSLAMPHGLCNLSSLIRDGTFAPAVAAWNPNHWTTREVPQLVLDELHNKNHILHHDTAIFHIHTYIFRNYIFSLKQKFQKQNLVLLWARHSWCFWNYSISCFRSYAHCDLLILPALSCVYRCVSVCVCLCVC